jgi:hypothetical protein
MLRDMRKFARSFCPLAGLSAAIASATLLAATPATRKPTKDQLNSQLREIVQYLSTVRNPLARPGETITKQQITTGTVSLFLPIVREDLAQNQIDRARRELSAINAMIARRKGAAQDKHRHYSIPPGAVDPSIPGRRLKIRGSAIVMPTSETPERPVFLTGYGFFQRVRDDLELLSTVGTNLIQIEIGPKELFPGPDVIDRTPLKRLTEVLDRAARVGVAVDVLLSPHYFPEWMLERIPELRKRREGFVQYCTHHPVARELVRNHVRLVVDTIKNHPALLSVCLANEPQNVEEPCELARAE